MSILDKQVNIYSVDTGAFFTRSECKLYRKIGTLKNEKKKIKEKIKELKDTCTKIKDGENYNEINEIIKKYEGINKLKNKKIRETKDLLLQILANKNKDELRSKNNFVRHLSPRALVDKNIISVFDSGNTRLLNMKVDNLSMNLIVVKTYYFSIIEDLIKYGFVCNGEKYKFFTASAGQIRTKKTIFIKEQLWKENEKTFLCGLTIDEINRRTGMNINKFLSYLSLGNSATDKWVDFDIDKTIVVPDFENEIFGEVDFIDDITFEINRQKMGVMINQTDGCGMILPSLSNKNFMVRLPWIKGLLAVFDFKKFIVEKNGSPIIKDIYGEEHNIFEEDIQIIFTKSQFKASDYYDNWNQYKEYFKKYNCEAGKCNIEEDYISHAKINYQMLQTLTDVTPNELQKMASKSNNKIEKLTSTVATMQEAFGVTPHNNNKTYLQQAIEIYPEILNDPYTKENIKQIKKSMIKNFKAGKLLIDGKYTFIVPDWYAICEKWFLNREPIGLLQDGQVSCNLYSKVKKLDCLRSPHLYKEHAVRENVINSETNKWFVTNALYVSINDLISKILMFDVDGDKGLIIANELFVQIAERNMKNIVPLYYNMKKAKSIEINPSNIYTGLEAAYTGGNIGIYSNAMSKIWNNDLWRDGTEEDKEEMLNVVKYLCLINNNTIDFAKTLYKPVIPEHISNLIHKYTKCKVPYFFKYAKDKLDDNVELKTNSTVNKLDNIIKDKRLSFKLSEFGKVDYKMLMNNPNVIIDSSVITRYNKFNREYHFKINMENRNHNNFKMIAKRIDESLTMLGYSREEISDMLVKHLYCNKNTKNKESLWFCYGDVIVNNIKRNINGKKDICIKCGKRFEKNHSQQIYCKECGHKYEKINNNKTVKCIDCGKIVRIDKQGCNTIRCDDCQKEHRRLIKREYIKKLRANNKNVDRCS